MEIKTETTSASEKSFKYIFLFGALGMFWWLFGADQSIFHGFPDLSEDQVRHFLTIFSISISLAAFAFVQNLTSNKFAFDPSFLAIGLTTMGYLYWTG